VVDPGRVKGHTAREDAAKVWLYVGVDHQPQVVWAVRSAFEDDAVEARIP
jgi:hypothetical protein